jgi:molybdenum cofactor guanylyltransferase
MATGIILAGGASSRMPGDKAFMVLSARRVMDIQLGVLEEVFEEILIVGNRERMERLKVYGSERVRVVEEPVKGKGPLGGIASGLELSRTDENFILACDMPFIKVGAVRHVLERLRGYQVSLPRTPGGLEPLHAAYRRDCLDAIRRQLEENNLKVSDFFSQVSVNYVPWEELARYDPTGRLLFNINSPEDMRRAAGEPLAD